MDDQQPLQGSCSCGRYNYVVVIPHNNREQAQVHFRTDDQHRRSQAALLTAFLRVPLSWYSSNTTPYLPDEAHHLISRTFSPVEEPHSQRKFCGYCGTHVSYWTEEPREEQEYIHITLGSLRNRDLDTLQDLDLLPEDALVVNTNEGRSLIVAEGQSPAPATSQPGAVSRSLGHGTNGPITWFEEMLDGSHLGRARKTRRGAGTTADGTTTVSWEISEYGDDEDVVMTSSGSASGSKRKIGDVVE